MDRYTTHPAIGVDETLLMFDSEIVAIFVGPDHAEDAARVAGAWNAELEATYVTTGESFPP